MVQGGPRRPGRAGRSTDPERFYVPPYVGPRGWVGVRLDVHPIDWEELAEVVQESYRLTAPKRLAALLPDF